MYVCMYNLQVYQARTFFFLLTERSLFHSKQITDIIEIVRLAVFLTNFLLDELVPIIHGKCFCRYHHFVPMCFDIVFLRRLGYIQSIEFYSSCNLLFSFEDSQWYLWNKISTSRITAIVIESQHAIVLSSLEIPSDDNMLLA